MADPDPELGITYCTLEDIEDVLDLPDPSYPGETLRFSDTSHPRADYVIKLIKSSEEQIDRMLHTSWREVRVKDRIKNLDRPEHDELTWRSEMVARGGISVMLSKDLRPWDPTKGDKMEMRRRYTNAWVDISEWPDMDEEEEGTGRKLAWFDEHAGILYIRPRLISPRFNSLRITYRYGKTDPVPEAIRRMCTLMVCIQILKSQAFYIKVGQGGDIASIRQDLIRGWQEEINDIRSSYQRTCSVVGLW